MLTKHLFLNYDSNAQNTQAKSDKDWADIENATIDTEFLDISCNAFSKIAFTQQLATLRVLEVSYNTTPISELILDAVLLPNLQHLYAYQAKLQKISFKGIFEKLETLHLAENELESFELGNFPQLKTLYLYKNPILNVPKEIFDKQQGNICEEVKNYFASLEEDGEIPNDQIKMLLLGNSTAGKSSLIWYLTSGEYDKEKTSTHGIEYIVWQPYKEDKKTNEVDRNLKVAVWDFGGQEFYHNTHALFFSNNAIYVVLFEKETNQQGKKDTKIFLYENHNSKEKTEKVVPLEHFHYHYWLNNIRHFNEDTIKLLVQNKIDKDKLIDISDACKQQYELNQREHIFYISVEKSFEENDDYIDEFNSFKKKLLRHIKTNIDKFSNSKKWQEIKNKVLLEWQDRNVLDFEEYVALCKEVKSSIHDKKEINNESQLDTLTKILHEQGVLLHFRHIEALKEKVFVNPQWIIDCIYRVLDYSVMNNEGKFAREHLEKVAQNIEKVNAADLEALLNNFKLVFEIKDEDGNPFFIAPQYLPETFDKNTQKFIKTLERTNNLLHTFTLSYPDFLPISTFLKFLAIYGNKHLDYWYNKNELFFEKDKKAIYAKCIRNNDTRQISISIQDNDASLKHEIFHALYEINAAANLEISIDGKEFTPLKEIKNALYESIYGEKYAFVFDTFSINKDKYTIKKELNELLAEGKVEEVIDKLRFLTEENNQAELYQDVIGLSASFNQNEKKNKEGIIKSEDYGIEYRRIVNALLTYIKEYKEE